MKKVIAIFAIVALAACGGASTEATNAPVDTTSLGRDTTTNGGVELSTDSAVAPTEVVEEKK